MNWAFEVVMVRGKRGQGVNILLTHEMDGHVQLLAEYNRRRNKPRGSARKQDDAETPYRASAVICDLAEKAQLQMPEHMRCTKQRKHQATMTQLIINLFIYLFIYLLIYLLFGNSISFINYIYIHMQTCYNLTIKNRRKLYLLLAYTGGS